MGSSAYIDRIYREYGLYVLDTRAIPAMTDGLKSSQRTVLWLMRNRADKIKTISLVGEMIASNLYVHGDAAAGDTISLLAAPYCNNRPLLTGIGAFGTLAEPTTFGAPRYTYVKRNKFAQDVLYADIDIVPMVENYDGSASMPGTFLPMIPTVLLNGIKGIAPGWATNILPRKYSDLVAATLEALQTGKVTTKLIPHYEGRDVRVTKRGTNQYTIFGKITKKNTSTVLVRSLPPELTLEKFKEYLIRLEEEGKITDWTDRSSEEIDIEIKMRRADLGPMDNPAILEFLKLRSLVTENITVQGIGGKKVVVYPSAEKLVEDWVKWRFEQYLVRYEYLLAREKEINLYWRYVIACFNKQLPKELVKLAGREDLKGRIKSIGRTARLPAVTDDILEKISGLASYKWTEEGKAEAKQRLAESKRREKEYTDMVGSSRRRKTVFKKELGAL